MKQIYGFAILHGEKVKNPADEVGPASIATFKPLDRSLSTAEIRILLKQIEHVDDLADYPVRRSPLPAHYGAQERAAGCDMGRGRL
jgi:hypothetical protein